MTIQIHKTDIVIIGGGIAGLWLLNRVRNAGYQSLLLEKSMLGGVQTLASQGMIHGGQKYTLTGKASKSAVNIAEMPGVWAQCFDGTGEIDLSGVGMLSDHQIMWATAGIAARAGVFAASKTVNANTTQLDQDNVPEALRLGAKGFQGKAYRMDECVMDIKALISSLAEPYKDSLYCGDVLSLQQNDDGVTLRLEGDVIVQAQTVVFTAGAGNEQVLKDLGVEQTLTQRRPLKQIMVKNMAYPLYGHCIVANPKPRVTLTAHPYKDKYVWYMGGGVAETSVARTDEEAMRFAKTEMQDIFPDICWDNTEWATWSGDRAEPYDATGHLPTGPHFKEFGNVLVAWPTKLTFAPGLGEKIMQWLEINNTEKTDQTTILPLPKADIGYYPWEEAQWHKL